MANVQRWRYGETNPINTVVDSAVVIEVGDICYLETDAIENAAAQADLGLAAANQEGIHDNFLGVAMSASASGETADVITATTGVFEFIIASATLEVGSLVGVAPVADASVLDQTVIAVATANLAIGRVVKELLTATLTVWVEIFPLFGGPNPA